MTQSQGWMRQTYPVVGAPYRYRIDEQEGRVTFQQEADVPSGSESAVILSIESRATGEGLCRDASGRARPFAWAWVGPELHLWLDGDLYIFQRVENRRRGGQDAADQPGEVLAPMPGAVLQVLVSEGDCVERNQTVVILESMKMELVITAPRDGVVGRISVEAGQQVERGMRLLELTPESDDGWQ